jgi:hypothetical protein
VGEAAARVGMSRKSAWQLRRRGEGTSFAAAFEAAFAAGSEQLHSIAFERAVEGVVKPVFYAGRKVGEQRIYDTRLLLALIARNPPSPSPRIAEVRRNWERWLDAVEKGLDEPPSPPEEDPAARTARERAVAEAQRNAFFGFRT